MGCHFLLQCVKVKSLSRVRLLATPWTAAHQAPPSMGFSRQEYWSGVPLPSPLHTLESTNLSYIVLTNGCTCVTYTPLMMILSPRKFFHAPSQSTLPSSQITTVLIFSPDISLLVLELLIGVESLSLASFVQHHGCEALVSSPRIQCYLLRRELYLHIIIER